ncbi:uncharacterized protein B0P05DRAFT_570462 [Gilbertella persicaria]|uniref:uncharacterized protein n=1 Tax=Gilbertella persicaria TaxID=101096 RepID=UPI00221F3691|nr:uncharacterized protein B0P05DRAFT_570462 [Gilbertella persicaria]KAI8084060.1 hypothetical protein B0P05DRAFT_570462 [Gilbertella persicaria]
MTTTQPEYRDPKKPKAVYVYTIAQESRYLIIENVPNLGVIDQLVQLCNSFGQVEEHRMLDNHTSSTDYADVIWIKYHEIRSARLAKRKLDNTPFFTSLLCVNYAPEYETWQDIRDKFNDRYQTVLAKLSQDKKKKIRHFVEEQVLIYDSPKEEEKADSISQDTLPTVKKRRRI